MKQSSIPDGWRKMRAGMMRKLGDLCQGKGGVTWHHVEPSNGALTKNDVKGATYIRQIKS